MNSISIIENTMNLYKKIKQQRFIGSLLLTSLTLRLSITFYAYQKKKMMKKNKTLEHFTLIFDSPYTRQNCEVYL